MAWLKENSQNSLLDVVANGPEKPRMDSTMSKTLNMYHGILLIKIYKFSWNSNI